MALSNMINLRLHDKEVCTSWLTQRSYHAAHCNLLLPITPDNMEDALLEFRREGEFGRYCGIRISGISDLTFLKNFPLLLYLEVINTKRVNTRHLDCLTNLRGLRLESPGKGVDFSCFPHLEVFVGDWHIDNCNLQHHNELRQLRIWHFNPCNLDLAILSDITRLEWLQLTQTNIKSLDGLETLEDLRFLEIFYASKLESLDALAVRELEIRELSIENSMKISSYEPITSARKLRWLKLFACATMRDLKWVKGMDYLDFFSFVNTNVEDGDLSPLLNLQRLQKIGTMDKRHYSIKEEALNKCLLERHCVHPNKSFPPPKL